MRQLTCRVATKEADAQSLGSYCFCKLDSGVCSIRCRMFSIVPILAEQTVKCTSSIKYCQIQIALFCSRLICPFGIAGRDTPSQLHSWLEAGHNTRIPQPLWEYRPSNAHFHSFAHHSSLVRQLLSGNYFGRVYTVCLQGQMAAKQEGQIFPGLQHEFP